MSEALSARRGVAFLRDRDSRSSGQYKWCGKGVLYDHDSFPQEMRGGWRSATLWPACPRLHGHPPVPIVRLTAASLDGVGSRRRRRAPRRGRAGRFTFERECCVAHRENISRYEQMATGSHCRSVSREQVQAGKNRSRRGASRLSKGCRCGASFTAAGSSLHAAYVSTTTTASSALLWRRHRSSIRPSREEGEQFSIFGISGIGVG